MPRVLLIKKLSMILRVTKPFEYGGREYFEGEIIKMGTADYKQVIDKVEMADKFTKQVIVKDKIVKKIKTK